MRVVVAAIGSRGDVAPFANLAARLAAAGHDVRLITHATLRHLVDPAIPVNEAASDPGELMASPAAKAVKRGNIRQLNATRHVFAEFVHSAFEPAAEALEDADVLIASTFAIGAVNEAVRRGVPVVRAHMWPEYPELDGPMPLLPYGWLAPRPLVRQARAGLRRVEKYLGGVRGWWRRGRLHLEARHPVGLTTATLGSLYAFSPHLIDEYPADGTVTGWWTDSRREPALSDALAEALDSGDDWIFIGFGSMAQEDPQALLRRLGEACARVRVRAVVQVGDVRGTPHPNLLCVGDEPHDELFRRVKVAVHHGGAGTTGSAVRAGVPSVVVPHFADQFYWGQRLQALGVAPRPVPRAFASERSLARSIGAALDPETVSRAAELAARVAPEDGCGRAVRQVETWLGR